MRYVITDILSVPPFLGTHVYRKRIVMVAQVGITLLALLTMNAQSVFAEGGCPAGMSALDCNALSQNWPNWVPDNGSSCGDGGIDDGGVGDGGTPNENAKAIFDFFVSRGYTPAQAAGIDGNSFVESGYDPLIYQGDGKDHALPPGDQGWGIVQWTPGSKIVNWATSQHPALEPGKLGTQVTFLWLQLDGKTDFSEKGAGDALKKARSAAEAARIFEEQYERPADPGATLQQRIDAAEKALALYGSDSQNPGSGNGGTADNPCGGVPLGSGDGQFTTDTSTVYPDINKVLARAKHIALPPGGDGTLFDQICGSGPTGGPNCYGACAHLAAEIWNFSSSGYQYAVGTDKGNGLWYGLVDAGHAHPKDRHPPLGALLFYDTGQTAGHVATYVGDNLIVSNDVGDSKSGIKGGVYIVPASAMEGTPWNLNYLGWADPIFGGGNHVHYGP